MCMCVFLIYNSYIFKPQLLKFYSLVALFIQPIHNGKSQLKNASMRFVSLLSLHAKTQTILYTTV